MPINGDVPAYIAITVVAFLLGAVVTMFCILLRKRREQEDRRK